MKNEAFVLPAHASFDWLHQRRHQPGNGERIDKALHAIEESNITKLRDVFQDISFNSNKLGDEEQKNDILRHILEDFAKPSLDLRPSRVGNLDIIGGAYEYLISRFAASAGKTASEPNVLRRTGQGPCPRRDFAKPGKKFRRPVANRKRPDKLQSRGKYAQGL